MHLLKSLSPTKFVPQLILLIITIKKYFDIELTTIVVTIVFFILLFDACMASTHLLYSLEILYALFLRILFEMLS